MSVQLVINRVEGHADDRLPPEAIVLRMPNREPELREWQAIEHIYREGSFARVDHTALLSPKFPTKTGLPFDAVVSFIEDNPGHDLYLFDHGPQQRYYNFNTFDFSEHASPGLTAKFVEGVAQIGEVADIAALGRSLPENSVNGNSWVGNAWFWREMVGEAIGLIDAIRARPAVWKSLCEPVICNGKIYPYLPIVLERFVPYWLMTRSGLSVKSYPYDRDYVLARCVRPLERPLVAGFFDTVNQWDEAGPWSPDRREFMRDLSRAIHRQLRSANDHLDYPWSGERIDPVR